MLPRKQARGVIFDFDGVLADSFFCLYEVVRTAFASIGVSLTPEEYRAFFLQNVKQAERERAGDEHRFQEVQAIIAQQASIMYERVPLFDFVTTFIPQLREHAELAIVSSTAAPTIRNKLAAHHIDGHFASILGADRTTSKIEKLEEVVSSLGWERDAVWFVSDTVGDLREGRAAGLRTIGVTWGFHERVHFDAVTPDCIADTESDLLRFIVGGTMHRTREEQVEQSLQRLEGTRHGV